MNRTIKFRAWVKKEKLMYQVEGLYLYKLGSFDLTFYTNAYKDKLFRNEGAILMQYTGLKDMNGVEIYEGDIVKMPDGANGPGSKGTPSVVTIDAYGVHPFSIEDNEEGNSNRVKVIGNIYENPELLEDK